MTQEGDGGADIGRRWPLGGGDLASSLSVDRAGEISHTRWSSGARVSRWRGDPALAATARSAGCAFQGLPLPGMPAAPRTTAPAWKAALLRAGLAGGWRLYG